METISLIVTVFFGVIVAVKIDYIKAARFKGVAGVLAWLIFAYLLLNTIGNLASGVAAENFVFAPITLLLAVRALRLAIEK